MVQFNVIAKGTSMGRFEAAAAEAAIEAYARDAGYESYADLCEVTGDDEDGDAVEVVEVEAYTLADLQDAWKRGYASIGIGDRTDLSDRSTFVGACVSDNTPADLAFETITQDVVDEINAGTQSDIRQHNDDNAEEIEAGETEAMDGETWAFDVGRAYAAIEGRDAA